MAKKPPATAKAQGAKADKVASVGPVQYLGQVRQEARKVVWPTWRETLTTTILVMIMVVLMGIFFFIVDWALGSAIRAVLGLGGE
ncbi:preprotein translocase SecE subunit [Litorimonas taeanensis]|uniref:Protein translocase subunit SecE n=1 Tax=Litorimonas taeanensis TaxID=568099 RepID=A0A420WIG8_9PROT|nr:preprotein translocase subunit SecE [Litorimonas taeanensis]RKQ70705.1 preprotein translocase SecE subunit [Litorimonas taeanensis]